MTDSEPPVHVGDTASTVQLSPCVGGLVRTWDETNSSRLWSVPDADFLRSNQGVGLLSRTLREEGRYREAGLLVESSPALMLQGRFPTQDDDGSVSLAGSIIRLEPAGEPSASAYDDFRAVLTQAVRHCIESNEYLVVEGGGWDAPAEPYCLFVVVADEGGPVNVIEAAPAPVDSPVWAPHCAAGTPGATLRAPATQETVDVAPLVMIEAIATWGLQPWDLAFTFGKR